MSDTARAVLAGPSYTLHVRAESWLGGQLLAADVPIDSGSEDGDRSNLVPQLVQLRVPRRHLGDDWTPSADDHPLAANGQRLRISLGVGVPRGVQWVRRGEFVIQSARADGDQVTVEARSLLQLVDEAELVSPYQPSGTFAAAVRGLVQPAIAVRVDAGLTDRSVPAGRVNIDQDRLGGVAELLDAWPAEAVVVPDGYLLLRAVTTPSVADLDVAGLTIGAPTGESTRDGAANVVVARGTASDGGQVQGVAYDLTPGSPRRYGGAFNPLPVPEYLFSPLLTTVAQCRAAAQTRLTRLLRAQRLPFTVLMPPRPDVELGDALSLPDGRLVTVEQYRLSYTGESALTALVAEVPA